MLITLCIIPLVLLTIIATIFGNEFMSITVSPSIFPENTSTIITGGLGNQATFNIDSTSGAIAIIFIIAIAGSIIGIRILGSGLAETSIRTLTIAMAYTGVWLVLSLLAIPLLFSIELFGSLIYIVLTIGYVIGVIQRITGV